MKSNPADSFAVDVEACRDRFVARQQKAQAEREQRRLQALNAVRKAVLQCAPRYPSIARAYLFGSVVRPGTFRSVSDVDVAVEGLGGADYFQLWRDLEETAPGWTIDLRDTTADASFAARVRMTGVLVYERESPGLGG